MWEPCGNLYKADLRRWIEEHGSQHSLHPPDADNHQKKMKTFTTFCSVLASAGSALGALTQVTGFGTNPTNVQMFISVPAKLATNPAIIVAVSSNISA